MNKGWEDLLKELGRINPSLNKGKYKKGQWIKWRKSFVDGHIEEGMGKITWVNQVDDTFEYEVDGLNFLLWEHEIISAENC